MHSREWKRRLGRNRSHEACLSNFMRKFSGIIFLLIFLFLIPQLVIAAQIRLAWDPNTERNLSGYWSIMEQPHGVLMNRSNLEK